MNAASILAAASIDNSLSFISAGGDGTSSISLTLDSNILDGLTYNVQIGTNAQSTDNAYLASSYNFSFNGLYTPPSPVAFLSSVPGNGASVATTINEISVTFDQLMNGTSVAAASSISGLGVSGLTYKSGSGTTTIVLNIVGVLVDGQNYNVTIGSSTLSVDGGVMPGNTNFSFSATATPPPAISVNSTSPGNGDTVLISQQNISVTFDSNMSSASVISAISISGSGVYGLTYVSGNGTPTIVFSIQGQLKLSESYTVTIGAAAYWSQM